MRILLIEDNEALALGLRKQLSRNYIVDASRTGSIGLKRALKGCYDIIILDLSLPDMGGLDICRAIRDADVSTPIVVLTGEADVSSRVALLNAGADDYVTKPFSLAELRARLGAMARRPRPILANGLMRVEDLEVDPQRRTVKRGDVEIQLRRKEFDILEYLMRNRGRPVKRSMLLEYAWNGNKESWNNAVDVHIKQLRDLVDKPFDSQIIKTAYGIGYMIEDT